MENLIVILADDSGPMLKFAQATVDKINRFLDEQRLADSPVSLYTFNARTGVRHRFTANAPETPRLCRNNDLFDNPDMARDLIYAPTGGRMRLADAVAETVKERRTMRLVIVTSLEGWHT